MRAEPHYVDTLDADAHTQVIRLLPVDRISADDCVQMPADSPLAESVRRHGVLQPLLVQYRRDGYRLIAGRKRLSAAAAVGVRAVPCIVHHVEDDEARALAEASNTSPSATNDAAPSDVATEAIQNSAIELSRSLDRIRSCSDLIQSSELTQQVMAGLVKAEANRAWCVATTLSIVGGAPLSVARTSVKSIVRRTAELCEPEFTLRRATLETRATMRDATDVTTDAAVLTAVLCGLVLAVIDLREQSTSEPIVLSALVGGGSRVAFNVARGERISRRASRSLPASSDPIVQAAEIMTAAHGGSLTIDGREGTIVLEIPLTSE